MTDTQTLIVAAAVLAAMVFALVAIWADRRRDRRLLLGAYRAGLADGGGDTRMAFPGETADPPAEPAAPPSPTPGAAPPTNPEAEMPPDDIDPAETADKLTWEAEQLARITDELREVGEQLTVLALQALNQPRRSK